MQQIGLSDRVICLCLQVPLSQSPELMLAHDALIYFLQLPSITITIGGPLLQAPLFAFGARGQELGTVCECLGGSERIRSNGARNCDDGAATE